MPYRLITTAAALMLLVAVELPAPAAAPDPLPDFLAREIVGQTLPLAEWQRFCEARIPRPKNCATATEWTAEACRLREEVLSKVVFRGAAAGWRGAPARVEWRETLSGGPGYRLKKLRYQALPGLWIPAVLYEPEKITGRVPAILNVNGHVGPPGKSVPYKQIRCINLAKRGCLALNVEWLGMGQLSGPGFVHTTMNQLDLCGTSGLAPFYLAMQRALDLLERLPQADPARLAVAGLSGGGWQTITISALDERVKLANPVAGYSSLLTRLEHFKDLGDSEQTPCDLATVADYAHFTAMLAPRSALLTYNAKDNCCFESGYALPPLVEAALPRYKLFGQPQMLRWHVNYEPGTHNFDQDNRQAFYQMVGDVFFSGQKFNAAEIPSDSEVKTAKELTVDLPEDNVDFNRLAVRIAAGLPRGPSGEASPAARCEELRQRLHAPVFSLRPSVAQRDQREGMRATFWRLALDGGTWTLPAAEFAPERTTGTTLVIADGGRKAAAAEVRRFLAAGRRVIAIDLLGFGENVIPYRNTWLGALVIAAVGERAWGLQSSQLLAVAKWAAGQGGAAVEVAALGPRSAAIALAAAALDDDAIGRLELHQPLGSLKELIEGNWQASRGPELFCFGLLERFDLKTLAQMAAPRPIALVAASARAQAELAPVGQ